MEEAMLGPTLERSVIPLLMVALLGPLACASAGASALIGEVWRWQGQSGPARGEWLEIPHPGRYTIAFIEDGSYTIRADCNTGNGGYSVVDDEIEFGLAALTEMACESNTLERRFLRSLKQVREFSRSGESLALHFGGDKGEMRFVAARRVGLEGTTWLVRDYNDGKQLLVSVRAGATLDVRFGVDQRVTGSAGCNRYFAEFNVEGERLSIGAIGASRRACSKPDGVMRQERAFLAALGSAATWRVRGEILELRTGGESLALELVAAVVGTVTLPAGALLPRHATLTVQVMDVSRTNAPSVVIREQVQSASRLSIPYAYEVSYDPADIDDRHSYAVIARVHDADGRLVFATNESVPVINRDQPSVGVVLALEAVR
jgi:heat shock protein HslJ